MVVANLIQTTKGGTIMEMEEIRSQFIWDKVDWSPLIGTYANPFGSFEVTENDINVFVENLYRDVARRLDFPFLEIRTFLEEENAPFYELKKRVFNKFHSYDKKDNRLQALQKTLRLPVIPVTDNVLMLFNNLSESDKMKFLEKIGKINVKIEYFE